MSGSVYRDAYAIGRYVDGKVRRLQTAYLGESPLSSAARAELAFLRHSNGEARWVPGGEILFEGLPDLQGLRSGCMLGTNSHARSRWRSLQKMANIVRSAAHAGLFSQSLMRLQV